MKILSLLVLVISSFSFALGSDPMSETYMNSQRTAASFSDKTGAHQAAQNSYGTTFDKDCPNCRTADNLNQKVEDGVMPFKTAEGKSGKEENANQ